MKKCILLCRVSTERQSLDTQEQELFKMAIKDGYEESNIILIAEKESGIKLDENERKGLNRMKQSIEEDSSIDCVYSWEISRISRRKKILFSILEYLTNKKIQLKIKEPSIYLLNDDGTINEAGETVFTLFAQLAESEMRNKKVRFKRGKEYLKQNGYFVGGGVLYGYSVINRKIEINNKQVAIINKIYDMYVNQNMSQNMIVNQLILSAEFSNKNKSTLLTFVRNILSNKKYTGDNLYPQIVTNEMYEQSILIASKNRKDGKKVEKNIYYCKGLIKCPICGKTYHAKSYLNNYCCTECPGNYININMIDSLIWEVSKMRYFNSIISLNKENREIYQSKLLQNTENIKLINIQIKDIKNKIDRINDRIDLDGYDINRGKKNIAILDKKIKEYKLQIENILNENNSINKIIKGLTENEMINKFDNINEINDDKIRKQIIDRMIDYIELTKSEGNNKEINIHFKLINDVWQYSFNSSKKEFYSGFVKLEIPYLSRFSRKIK